MLSKLFRGYILLDIYGRKKQLYLYSTAYMSLQLQTALLFPNASLFG